MEQLSLIDLLFPKPKDTAEENTKLYEEWLKTATPVSKMIYKTFRGSWNYFVPFKKGIQEIKQIENSLTYHYGNMKKDYYIYSLKFDEEEYRLVFQLDNEIIFLHNRFKDVFKEPICFPACCMNYFNTKGDEIHFSIRDKFIMDGLGFKNARMRNDVFKGEKKKFYNTELFLSEIIKYLETGEI